MPLHYFIVWYPLLAPVAYFILDRILPRFSTTRSTSVIATRVGADIVRVVIPSSTANPYAPGDWVNIRIPSLGWHQTFHPFSIGSYYPESPERKVLYIKARGRWTRKLVDSIEINNSVTLSAYVDGTFGSRATDYLQAEALCVVAAGTGIAALIPYVRHYHAVHNGSKVSADAKQRQRKVTSIKKGRNSANVKLIIDFFVGVF
jgi:predicted ferric reductase